MEPGAGGSAETAAEVGPGFRLLDRYEIVRHVGTGGMGTVWEARDLKLDQTVALKSVGGAGGAGADPEQRRPRMLREARTAAAQLRRAPRRRPAADRRPGRDPAARVPQRRHLLHRAGRRRRPAPDQRRLAATTSRNAQP